jgi:peptidoglycan hydrolase CwlO-like protein
MTANQLDKLFEQAQKTIVERDTARAHVVRLQDELKRLKSRISTAARKSASKRNGLKGGRPRKQIK